MAFVQNPINYAEEYSRELANAYPYLSYFSDIYAGENANRYRPVNGKGVWIPSIQTSGAKAANRDQVTGVFNRNFNNNWELKSMSMDREWDTLVDPLDLQESNETATIANITRSFNEQQKVPEMDAYAASKLAGFAGDFGGVDGTTLTTSNILAQWDAYLAYMTDQRINRDRVVCKMTPSTYKLLKEAAGLTRFVETGEGFRGVDRNVARLDGVRIEEVPSDIMQTAFDFTEGFTPAVGANAINLLLYAPDSVVAPVVYDTAMISAPSAQSKGKYLYYERYYYDVFPLLQRQAGFFANMTAPSVKAITVTSVVGASTGDTIIGFSGYGIDQNGNPYEGLDVYLSVGESAALTLTYGAALPSATWTKVSGQNNILVASQTAGKYATVAIVNKYNDTVIAGNNVVEVVGA